MMTKMQISRMWLVGIALLAFEYSLASAQAAPPLPTDVPVWMVGHASIDGRRLVEYSDVEFTIGGTDKEGPLEPGEHVRPAAHQVMSLRRQEREGRDVWVRSFETRRAGDPAVVARGEIVLDRRTLAPLTASLERGGSTTSFEYDWSTFNIRSSDGGAAEAVDLTVLEAGAHETWVAAIPWTEGLRVMIPTVLAGGGGKWWAVPHVTGSEDVDLGDGRARAAWVVEMDWWGMGADQEVYTPGGGPNGSAGEGGKYWVLKEPPAGMPPVVRIQTQSNPTVDNVVQIQR